MVTTKIKIKYWRMLYQYRVRSEIFLMLCCKMSCQLILGVLVLHFYFCNFLPIFNFSWFDKTVFIPRWKFSGYLFKILQNTEDKNIVVAKERFVDLDLISKHQSAQKGKKIIYTNYITLKLALSIFTLLLLVQIIAYFETNDLGCYEKK